MDATAELTGAIYSEQSEEASFLWMQRRHAVEAPQYRLSDLAQLDESLAACVDALLAHAPAASYPQKQDLLAMEEVDLAVATLRAALDDSHPVEALVTALGDGHADPASFVQALAWTSPAARASLLQRCAAADAGFNESPWRISLDEALRSPPTARLEAALASPDPGLRRVAWSAAGTLGAVGLAPQLGASPGAAAGPKTRWSWARAALLLGRRDPALDLLAELASGRHALAAESLRLHLIASPPEAGHELLASLGRGADGGRQRILGTGWIGDPRYVPWLIEGMEDPRLARIAFEAFVLITGADVNLDELESMPPEGFEDGPSDDPKDDDIEVPEDVARPWPNLERVKAWWSAHRGSLPAGGKRLLGQAIDAASCKQVLLGGTQPQRIVAALHRALLRPGTALFPTDAPAWRQAKLLEALA